MGRNEFKDSRSQTRKAREARVRSGRRVGAMARWLAVWIDEPRFSTR